MRRRGRRSASHAEARQCRKPLLAYEGSPASERALDVAIDIASARRGRLTILSAVGEVPYLVYWGAAPQAVDELQATLLRDAGIVLEEAVARVPRGIPVTKILCRRPIRQTLLAQVECGHHDLLILGSRGCGPIGSLLRRNLAREVLRASPVPVLVVDAGTQESGGPERAAGAPVAPMRARQA